VATLPLLAGPVVIVWLLLFRLAPRWAVPAAMLVAIIAVLISGGTGWLSSTSIATVQFVSPTFDPFTILSLGVPLFIVTMAGQNVPGFTVLATYDFPAYPRFALVTSRQRSPLDRDAH
jgi:benzoate membrane transport protein